MIRADEAPFQNRGKIPEERKKTMGFCHESELWKSKAGVLVYKDRGGFKIDLATGQN